MLKLITGVVACMSFVLAYPANAHSAVTWSSIPTPGLPGFDTFTVNASSNSYPVNGLDLEFSGMMNQINPSGLPTIFQDNNAEITAAGGHVLQDSQFLFDSDQILSLDTYESSDSLGGPMTNLSSFNVQRSLSFAQLVIPTGSSVSYSGAIEDGSLFDGIYAGVIEATEHSLNGVVGGSGDLSFELQQAFRDRKGGPIVLEDAIMLSNANIDGSLEDLGWLGAWISLEGTPQLRHSLRGFAISDESGNVDLEIYANFPSLPPDTVINGSVFVYSAVGDPNFASFPFTLVVPEPNSAIITALAMVGLLGLVHRK